MKAGGGKIWFSATELADLRLPALPATKRKINERAANECWALRVDIVGLPLARPRAARGGGLEYHFSLLPDAARAALIRRGVTSGIGDARETPNLRDAMWSWFGGQSARVRAEAERRAGLVAQIDALVAAGITRSNAVHAVAASGAVAGSTLWSWLAQCDGIAAEDRIPHLAPRHKGGGKAAEIDEELWQILCGDYLRASRPTFSSCYERLARVAAERGLSLPAEKTLKRKIEREVDGRLVIARRQGAEALRLSLPAQQRSVAHYHAMQAVNIDGHKFDVFVRNARGEIVRPVMVGIQDVFSRKLLAWRLGETESAVLTRLAFADLFRKFGIPRECILDNGRAFASKWITGGAKTRFRFKIRDDEPTGLLTALGIQTRWAMPYRGQSKPVERAWRELADRISRHPAIEGAWTGNRPDAKPENYASKAVAWDVFVRLIGEEIAYHNARLGRRTETANGRSFDQVFDASYAVSPIGKATPEQLRLALLTGEQLATDRKTGEIRIAGNRYWSPELNQVAGKRVTVRFDPDQLHSEVHVYNQAGAFLVTAACLEAVGFDNMGAAKERARQEANLRRAVREVERQEGLMGAAQIAAMLPHGDGEAPLPDATIVRPVRVAARNGAATALAREDQNSQFMDRFGAAVTQLRLVE